VVEVMELGSCLTRYMGSKRDVYTGIKRVSLKFTSALPRNCLN
jgi:hypothetical protein